MKRGHSQTTNASQSAEDLEVTIIKKSNGVCSQQIKMKLPGETTFGQIVAFMHQNNLLKTKAAIVRPAQKDGHILGHNRKIQ